MCIELNTNPGESSGPLPKPVLVVGRRSGESFSVQNRLHARRGGGGGGGGVSQFQLWGSLHSPNNNNNNNKNNNNWRASETFSGLFNRDSRYVCVYYSMYVIFAL